MELTLHAPPIHSKPQQQCARQLLALVMQLSTVQEILQVAQQIHINQLELCVELQQDLVIPQRFAVESHQLALPILIIPPVKYAEMQLILVI